MVKNFFHSILIVLTIFFSSFSSDSSEDYDEQNELINNWHKSAAKADYAGFFDILSKDFVYLGTAPGERWNKDQFASFCQPYFDKGSAWDFTPSNRVWARGKSKRTIWFTEDLETWMQGCRGSGILLKEKGKWKLAYYNLTVLIENEKIEPFIQLRLKDIIKKD